MRKRILLFSIFYLITLNVRASFSDEPSTSLNFQTYQVQVNGINFRIDPRIELFNIIAMQFGHNGMTLSNIPYKKEMLDYFADYSGHKAPQLLLETWKKGWGVDDPIFFLLYLDEDLHIKEGLPDGIIERGGGMEHLKKLAGAFRDYAQQSQFQNFFEHIQRPFYEQVLKQTAYNFHDFDVIKSMEHYYGGKANSYNLILNLMGGYGNFGRAITSGKEVDLYAIVQTRLAAGDLPTFVPSASLTDLILHEFSHGFVNPAVDRYADRVATFDSLYSPIEQSMKFQAYHSWHTVVNEHIVRTNVIRMIRNMYGDDLASKMFYRYEMGRRFIYIDALDRKLDDFEQQRDQYPSFSEFVPELLMAFENLPDHYIKEKQKKVEHMRWPQVSEIPKPRAYAKDSTTVFIVGSEENKADAQQAMNDWVKMYRDMINKQIKIISDREAMEMDLTGKDLVIFGTQEGNALLKKFASNLPVTITDKAIITNKIIEGDHLQLVTSWVNPYDENHVMTIYTAQKTADIKNLQMSPDRENYHYWVGQKTITLDKGDYVNWGEVWRPNPDQ